jgi:hypothetical protein
LHNCHAELTITFRFSIANRCWWAAIGCLEAVIFGTLKV